MENTVENKASFFAQYWGQKVLKFDDKTPCLPVTVGTMLETPNEEVEWLELKPLSQITDEDAIEVGKFMGFNWDNPTLAKSFVWMMFLIPSNDSIKEELIIKQMLFDLSDVSSTVDLIRSKGYAYKYMGLSVEEQKKYGWIKLTQ